MLPSYYNGNVFCAQNVKEDEATCPGDSGGPVIAFEPNALGRGVGRFLLIGTVHGAFDDCSNENPGIFVENDDLNVLEFLQKEAFGRVCDYRGYINETADGLCNCKNNVLGKTCNNCQKGFWNLTQDNDDGCQQCTCNVNGSVNDDICAHRPDGDCECKIAVTGEKCEYCKPGYWGFGEDLLSGCKSCIDCNEEGTVGGSCRQTDGICICKDGWFGNKCDKVCDACYENGTINKTRCDKENGFCTCHDGFYGFKCLFKCPLCDPNGSISSACNKLTGECECHSEWSGPMCEKFTNKISESGISFYDPQTSCKCQEPKQTTWIKSDKTRPKT